MNWKDLTLKQYQDITVVLADSSNNEADTAAKLVAICYALPLADVDSMTVDKLGRLTTGLAFLHTAIPEYEPVKFIEVNGRRYRCIYDVRELKAARYMEAKTYGSEADLISNLHKVAASMVVPQMIVTSTKVWWQKKGSYVDAEYQSAQHSQYADDMQAAPFIVVYSAVVFFYQVYALWMRTTAPCLIAELVKKGKSEADAAATIRASCNFMDGIIAPLLLRNTSVSA